MTTNSSRNGGVACAEVTWTCAPDRIAYEALLRLIFDPTLEGLSPADLAHLRASVREPRCSERRLLAGADLEGWQHGGVNSYLCDGELVVVETHEDDLLGTAQVQGDVLVVRSGYVGRPAVVPLAEVLLVTRATEHPMVEWQ
jgi:hypothetical protein